MSRSVALRIGLRELRGGLSGFRVFLACLALGVMAIAAVGSVRAAIERGLSGQAAAILGGDAEIRLTYRFASEAEKAWMSQAAHKVSEVADFRSMAVAERDGERRRVLVQAKAVDAAYPIYGSVATQPEMPLDEALAVRGGVPGLIAERALVARLGLKPGDRVRLGTEEFEFRATLAREPDRISAGFGLGPRVIVRLSALAQSGLLGPGTLFDTQYRLQLPETTDLSATKAEAERRFAASGLRWKDRRDGAPGTSRFVARMGAFLVLVGLAGLAVGGIGVSAAVRA
ncbi:MAG: ABC transporter permease, partial [Paracoccaceae bacterium]